MKLRTNLFLITILNFMSLTFIVSDIQNMEQFVIAINIDPHFHL